MTAAQGLKELLHEMGISPESEPGQRLAGYLALLEKWNTHVNLTASVEWRLIGPLFREAVWAAGLYSPEKVSHLDIGSGAGFPALPLKILCPQMELDLVESRGKKGQFLATAAHHLGLGGVSVRTARLDEYLRQVPRGKTWDCVSWKAVKLGRAELRLLREHSGEETQLWMFHGKEPAMERPEDLNEFRLLQKEKVPGTSDSYLSILAPA